MDFAKATCEQRCSYCYVDTLVNIRKAYGVKISKNYISMKLDPLKLAQEANKEYKKLKTNISVRAYGAGDYKPTHYTFFENLDFSTYLISKNLTKQKYQTDLLNLLALPNISSIVLSFDEQNINNYTYCTQYRNHPKIKFCYTGLPTEYSNIRKSYKFDIFFNTKKSRAARTQANMYSESCPCGTGQLQNTGACSICKRCIN